MVALGARRRTTGYRHDSIPTAIQALQAQSAQQQNTTVTGQAQPVSFDFTEDPTRFTDENLGGYDAVMFISTTGDDGESPPVAQMRPPSPSVFDNTHPLAHKPTSTVLDSTQAQSFHTYLQNGGNFIGIHSSSDCLTTEGWFVETQGARFDYHPDLQEAVSWSI